jgi:hypothetical protein
MESLFRQSKQKIEERFSAIPLCGTRSVDTMTISKPVIRVAFFLLISLTLIAATYMTVQGAWAKPETNRAQAHEVSGLQTNLNHDRLSSAEVQSLQMQSGNYAQPGQGSHKNGGCHSDSQVAPQD